MTTKIKNKIHPNYNFLLECSKTLNIKEFDLKYYNKILLFYKNEKIIGLVNYCITPSMKGKFKLFIRNMFNANAKYLDDIIKLLCKYCDKKNYSIMTTIDEEKSQYTEVLLSNNFIGKNILYRI